MHECQIVPTDLLIGRIRIVSPDEVVGAEGAYYKFVGGMPMLLTPKQTKIIEFTWIALTLVVIGYIAGVMSAR